MSLPRSTDGETGVQKLNRLIKVGKLSSFETLTLFFLIILFFN